MLLRGATRLGLSPASLLKTCSNNKTRPFEARSSSVNLQNDKPFRMAVIGSGPAGFYTAYRVMSKIEGARIDMYERLPVPFGLVRFGVAPDHPEVKNCQDKFSEVASSPDFNFIGNVEVGKQLPLGTLKEHYNAIVFAYGASEDRKLGIPGEDTLQGVYSARHLVGWYNGLPEYAGLEPDLSTSETAVVIGQGNVALDIARIFLTDIDVLRKTDMTDYALASLAKSRIKRVHIVGRRGPLQVFPTYRNNALWTNITQKAAFTIKEVRELMHLPNVSFRPIDPGLLPPIETKLPRAPRRLVSLLREGTHGVPLPDWKSWSLDSMLMPERFESGHSKLERVRFLRTQFEELAQRFAPAATVIPMAAEHAVTYEASLAFRSIGYKSLEIEGMEQHRIPFDQRRGIIVNDGDGRILKLENPSRSSGAETPESKPLPGFYCAGWVKRGPAGVIANTMDDSFSTADAIISDWGQKRSFLPGGDGWPGLSALALEQGARIVSWQDWLKLNAVERARGSTQGRERIKVTAIPEMLALLE